MRVVKEIRPPGWTPPEITDKNGIRLNTLLGMIRRLIEDNAHSLGMEILEISANAVPLVKQEVYLRQGLVVSFLDDSGTANYINLDLDSPSDRTPRMTEEELRDTLKDESKALSEVTCSESVKGSE